VEEGVGEKRVRFPNRDTDVQVGVAHLPLPKKKGKLGWHRGRSVERGLPTEGDKEKRDNPVATRKRVGALG